jgi:serpin B
MEVFGGQEIPYAVGEGWRATELRYLGPDGSTPLAMTLVMPDDLEAFEQGLTAERLHAINASVAREQARQQIVTDEPDSCGVYPYQTQLLMPKFGIATRADLVPILKAMGVQQAFDSSRADFTGITREDRLSIGMVVHEANIDVDERGTEAAAATAVGADTGGCLGPEAAKDRRLRLDHPFLFFLHDVQTGAVLFMGRVTDPTVR